MKKLIETQEVEGEGFLALIGEQVLIFSLNYIYTGKLTGSSSRYWSRAC